MNCLASLSFSQPERCTPGLFSNAPSLCPLSTFFSHQFGSKFAQDQLSSEHEFDHQAHLYHHQHHLQLHIRQQYQHHQHQYEHHNRHHIQLHPPLTSNELFLTHHASDASGHNNQFVGLHRIGLPMQSPIRRAPRKKTSRSSLSDLADFKPGLTSLTDEQVYKGVRGHDPCRLEDLPTEVLLRIFDHLDDMTLWCLRLASVRCRLVIDNRVSEMRWADFVHLRWPLFTPRHKIASWRLVYLNLMESVTCRFCLERLRHPAIFRLVESSSIRRRRIISEIESLCADPPYGIKALALDTETYSHCLAGISGPSASPYEGGIFYVHVLIPDSHPMRPPVIRFLTRVLHPNISFHGDVGLDCIRHNWSLTLTLEKLLISIQSLLTDPYTHVCMEPVIGTLYTENRDKFEELARLWTWKFACHDYLSADFVDELKLPDYIGEMQATLERANVVASAALVANEKDEAAPVLGTEK
ncbi:unnamed protein product [Protopolystoma xenopodis]|uniref:UBC core domain-containing protein n=1 Tax=Protopolystoma xenopodis TaxID=117903 RepID=A0A448WMS2_9PLAT|nr:unnamed protein product [Protopolystoma xenopodis]